MNNSQDLNPIFQRPVEDEMSIEFLHQAHPNAPEKGIPEVLRSSHSGLRGDESETFLRGQIKSEGSVEIGMIRDIFCLCIQIANGFGPNDDLPLHRRPFL